MTNKTTSRILSEMHESAQDLRNAGFITKRRMLEYDALCLDPVQKYSTEDIHLLREKNNISQ